MGKIILSEPVKIYKDPETKNHFEGYAQVWAILEETDRYYRLVVSFMADPTGRKVERIYYKE